MDRQSEARVVPGQLERVEEEVRGVVLRQHRDRRGVRQDQARPRLLEDGLEAVAGVLGVDRQVRAARLQHREQGDHQVGRPRQRHRDHRFRSHPAPGQFARQAVGPGVHLAVRERLALGDHGDLVRGPRRLCLDELVDRDVRSGDGRVVELDEQPVAFGRVQDVDLGDLQVGAGRQLSQDPHEAGPEQLHGVLLEDALRVLEDEVKVRVERRHQGQRVVGARGRAQAREGDPVRGVGGGADPFLVDRVRLEDDQRVEEGLQADGLLDLREPVVVVVQEPGLPALQPGEDLGEGVAGPVLDAYGKGVDEHPDDRVDVRHLGRAPGDGGAEHHVLAAGELAEQQPPGTLDQGVDGDAQLGGAPAQGAGLVLRERDVDLADALALSFGAGNEQGRLLDACQLGRPHPGGLLLVLAGAPGQEIAEVAGRGQTGRVAVGRVEQQQVPHEQGHGPAVDEHVVGGHHELGAAVLEDGERHADQRRGGHVEVGAPVIGEERLEPLGPFRLVEGGQVEVLPRQ